MEKIKYGIKDLVQDNRFNQEEKLSILFSNIELFYLEPVSCYFYSMFLGAELIKE